MKKKIAGIILASVLTFSAMAGVQASAEDRLWENSMEADGVKMKELICPKVIQKLRKIHRK